MFRRSTIEAARREWACTVPDWCLCKGDSYES